VVPPPVVPPPVVPPPVVPPPVVPPEPPHSAEHSFVQLLQMQSPMAWNSVTAVLPAVVAQVFSQALSPEAQLLRQVMSALHFESPEQVLICDSQAPPVPSTMFWQVSQVLVDPVVPPVPAVVPPVPPVPPVEPPPHCEAHSVLQPVVQMQSKMALRVVWLAAGAALLQLVSQVESLQPWRQFARVAQAMSAWQAATCEAQAPLEPCASFAQVWQSAPEVVPPVVEPVVPPVEVPPVVAALEHQLVTI
jgi:hypothetical protein